MKKIILLVGVVFLLGLSGCNDDDSKTETTDTTSGKCKPMFS